MSIGGIILAMASLNLVQVSRGYQLHQAARELATDLQFARLLAVKENGNIQVVLNTESYEVRASNGSIVKSRTFGIDYPAVTLSPLTVTFDSRGNSSAGRISVSNPVGNRTISVGSTGKVKLG